MAPQRSEQQSWGCNKCINIFHIICKHSVALLVHCAVPAHLGGPASPPVSRRPPAGWCWWGAEWPEPDPRASWGQSRHWGHWASLWDPMQKSHDEHKQYTRRMSQQPAVNVWHWCIFLDSNHDVFAIFRTLKETSTAKVTGSWWCSMWQTRLVTTLSGLPPVTIRSKSKHSFSSGITPTKYK